jgi:hypothetical protein
LAGDRITSGYRSKFPGSKNTTTLLAQTATGSFSKYLLTDVCLLRPVFLPQHPVDIYCGVNSALQYYFISLFMNYYFIGIMGFVMCCGFCNVLRVL